MMDDPQISSIRNASRRIVRALGFMGPTLAGTDLPASAVHAVIEIGQAGDMTAASLASRLNLEKSSISRMIRKLVERGEIAETVSDRDARAKHLSLTERGRETLVRIDAFGTLQVASALSPFDATTRQAIENGLAAYAGALEDGRRRQAPHARRASIEPGYRTGIIGRCTEMHAHHYGLAAGFGADFESIVASGMAGFVPRLDRDPNGLWAAMLDGDIVGTIAIDGEDLQRNAAHLRWFIVSDRARGYGLGRRLLGEALSFCDRHGFPETELWTFAGLDAARHLYETSGFRMVEERRGAQWGMEMTEQRYIRPLPKASVPMTGGTA